MARETIPSSPPAAARKWAAIQNCVGLLCSSALGLAGVVTPNVTVALLAGFGGLIAYPMLRKGGGSDHMGTVGILSLVKPVAAIVTVGLQRLG